MTGQSFKGRAVGFHLQDIATHIIPYASGSVNVAQFVDGLIMAWHFLTVTGGNAIVTVQDSDDDTSFANTSFTFTQNAGSTGTARFIFLHPHKLRAFVRLSINTNGSTITGGGVQAIGSTPSNGELEATDYAIDTGI